MYIVQTAKDYTGMIELFLGNCLEKMRGIADASVDMVLCDLPYNTTRCVWDKQIDLAKLWKEYGRVCKENAAIVLFSQMPFTVDLVNSNRKAFRYEWIWYKTACSGFLNANKMPLKVHENVLIFYNKLPVYNPQKWKSTPYVKTCRENSDVYNKVVRTLTDARDGMRFPVDILRFSRESSNAHTKARYHPTQKPVALLEYLIKTYTNENAVVLDNTMGSGSTGVACVNTSRDFIGIELMQEYFDIAQERIAKAEKEKQAMLFSA